MYNCPVIYTSSTATCDILRTSAYLPMLHSQHGKSGRRPLELPERLHSSRELDHPLACSLAGTVLWNVVLICGRLVPEVRWRR